MNEILKVLLIRTGLTYAGVSLGIYWVSEEMISSRAATLRNPSWRLIKVLRQWVLLSWQTLGVGLLLIVALGLVALINFIIADIYDEHTLQKNKKLAASEAEAFRFKQEEESKARAIEKAHLEKANQEQALRQKQRETYDLFSTKQTLSDHEGVSIEEMARRSLDAFKK